jgi:hypothetical protein
VLSCKPVHQPLARLIILTVLPVTAALPSCLLLSPGLQDDLMPKYAELVYNGFWFSPEREALQALVDKTQEFVTGTVRLKLYKVRQAPGAGGQRITVGQSSVTFACAALQAGIECFCMLFAGELLL